MSRRVRAGKRGLTLALALLAAMPLFTAPAPAAARGPETGRGHGEMIRELPRGYARVRVHDREYFTHRGRFYRRAAVGYVVVAAPLGAVVATLPLGFVNVTLGASRYFLAGGAYYRRVPAGYVVVEPPAPVAVAGAPAVVVQAARLNVRSGPGMGYAVIDILNHGDGLYVYGNAPGWYYVRLPGGRYGWVMERFTLPVQAVPQG